MMLTSELSRAVDAVTDAIKQSREYLEYEKQKKAVRNDPEASRLVERARDIQVRLMNIPEKECNSDYAESLQNEYEEISENTSVYEYSRAESGYVTMIREVFGTIIENTDL